MTRKTVILTVAAALVGCGVGTFGLKFAWATPPSPTGFTSVPLVGPVLFDEIRTKAESEDWEIKLKTEGLSDVYMTYFKLAPGAHGGWHSHPGPSIICVKSGTATFYDDCVDPTIPLRFPAGTGFVEEAGCVHILANEGDVDLEVYVTQIVPRGVPRRIDQPDPRD